MELRALPLQSSPAAPHPARARVRGALPLAAAGVVLASFFAMTWQQAQLYTGIERFYRLTLQKNPRCWMAHNNLAHLLLDAGRTDEAARHYEETLRLKPDSAKAHTNLGLIARGRHDLDGVHGVGRRSLLLQSGGRR